MMNNEILILVGPSGVGKTTVAYKMLDLCDEFEFVRSATSRAPRGDGNDNEYIYVTKEEFAERVRCGRMLEHVEYSGNYYGTPASEVERILEAGRTPLLILELNGAMNLKTNAKDFKVFVFYIYEELDVIEKRLSDRERQNPTAKGMEAVQKRMSANKKDYSEMRTLRTLFDATIKNVSVEDAAKTVMDVFNRMKNGEARNSDEINSVTESLYISATEEK